MKGFVIAAPASGSGKTTVTLGLLRALRDSGVKIAPAKAGPDYIDPAYHSVASGVPCINLDPWAMRPDLISALASRHAEGGKTLVVEGMMGLFDGALDGKGSAASSSGVATTLTAGSRSRWAAASSGSGSMIAYSRPGGEPRAVRISAASDPSFAPHSTIRQRSGEPASRCHAAMWRASRRPNSDPVLTLV